MVSKCSHAGASQCAIPGTPGRQTGRRRSSTITASWMLAVAAGISVAGFWWLLRGGINEPSEDASPTHVARTWIAAPHPTMLEQYECTQLHMIHVGKTGGTSALRWFSHLVKDCPAELMPEGEPLILHPHSFKLGMAPLPTDCYAFFIRDPIERFVSGYYSHFRKALTQESGDSVNRVMDKKKLWALHRFHDVAELAEALYVVPQAASVVVAAATAHCIVASFHLCSCVQFSLPCMYALLPRTLITHYFGHCFAWPWPPNF